MAMSNNIFLLITNIYIYKVVIPKRSKMICRNRSVPKYSVPIDKPKRTPKRYS